MYAYKDDDVFVINIEDLLPAIIPCACSSNHNLAVFDRELNECLYWSVCKYIKDYGFILDYRSPYKSLHLDDEILVASCMSELHSRYHSCLGNTFKNWTSLYVKTEEPARFLTNVFTINGELHIIISTWKRV